VTPDDRWLAAVWPFVRAQLPEPSATVTELGCGPLGGFVPALRFAGYEAVGVDPHAPDGLWYRQAEFEQVAAEPVGAVIACTSLHHVADVGSVLDRIRDSLVPGGVLVVVEWARERFDEATARWAEQRLPPSAEADLAHEHDHDHEDGWLAGRCAEWRASGETWADYLRVWSEGHGLHEAGDILREVRARFEVAAIDAGLIQPGRVQFAARRP
jgi:SAM-dependent methyltransferase